MSSLPREGIDFNCGEAMNWPQAVADGKELAISYGSTDDYAPFRNWTVPAAKGARDAGLDCGMIYQNHAPNSPEHMTELKGGRNRGITAAVYMQQFLLDITGQPGQVAWFAVDFWTTPDNWAGVGAFFEGVRSVIGLARVGAYGTRYTMDRLKQLGDVSWFWQTWLHDDDHFGEGVHSPVMPGVHLLQYGNPVPVRYGARDYCANTKQFKPVPMWRTVL